MSTGENAGGYPCDRLASHPVGGGGGGGERRRNAPSRFMLRKAEISASLMGISRLVKETTFYFI